MKVALPTFMISSKSKGVQGQHLASNNISNEVLKNLTTWTPISSLMDSLTRTKVRACLMTAPTETTIYRQPRPIIMPSYAKIR